MSKFYSSTTGYILQDQGIFTLSQREQTVSGVSNISNHTNSVNYEVNLQRQNQSTTIDSSSSSTNWMESIWTPPNLLNIIAGNEFNEARLDDFTTPIHQQMQQHSGGSFHSTSSAPQSACSNYFMMEQISPNLKRPGPIHQQQPSYSPFSSKQSMNRTVINDGEYEYEQISTERAKRINHDCQIQLIILKQPEEQHRARYASEGSRGAIKDRSGTTYCCIQLVGYYRPTRVELFAAEKDFQGQYVQHSQYKLITVAGKSSTMTPCKRIIAEDETERLEIILRPENRMIGILDCIGIMKICSYGSPEEKRPRKRKRKSDCSEDQFQQNFTLQNSVYIVARAFVPLPTDDVRREAPMDKIYFEIFQAVTEPIRCVQQLGTPDIIKMSMESCGTSGGQELFIIGRNFDTKDMQILFREYKNDGSLGWSAEATIDRRLLHQCHVVCQIPAYQNLYRNATVSLTIICGTKQSHPKNFHYTASEREDDDDEWRPPDSSIRNNYQTQRQPAIPQNYFDYSRRKGGNINTESPEYIYRPYFKHQNNYKINPIK